jgi:two-component system, LytTR family, sensor kinase
MTRVQRHILFWIAYILFKTYLNVSDNIHLPLEEYAKLILGQLVLLTVKVPLIYSCFYVIDRYLEMKWQLWGSIGVLLALIVLGSIGLSTLNHLIVLPLILKINSAYSIFNIASLVYHSFTIMFVAGVAVAIRLFRRQHQSRLREAILQKEKTETELKYLKGQINPHFLFNTLNNIYSLARKGSAETAEAVMRLSKMMRFMLYESEKADILLQDELTLIRDYIKLEQLRYTDRLAVSYNENIDDSNRRIAPLLVIHFVENAFKHGVSESRSDSFVNVDIKLKSNVLKATIVNSKTTERKNGSVSIGMENIRRQLNILYPQHVLTIEDQDQKYSVELTIPFNN